SLNPIEAAFTGMSNPALVVVRTDTDSSEFTTALQRLATEAVRSEQMAAPAQVEVNPAHRVARIAIPLAGNGVDGTSTRALLTLRERVLPDTLGQVPGTTFAVTGATAASYDKNQMMKQTAPWVFGFVLTFAFVLLLVSFRSIVIAAKAIVLNLLSVGAAYGVVVAVFQYGWGERLLNF